MMLQSCLHDTFLQQGFRKYLTQSKDHEELLAFLLGGIVKDKARYHQLQRHEQPERITVKVSELDERVRLSIYHLLLTFILDNFQAKDHDIFDTAPFLHSRLFATNGYTLNDDVIEKRFKQADE